MIRLLAPLARLGSDGLLVCPSRLPLASVWAPLGPHLGALLIQKVCKTCRLSTFIVLQESQATKRYVFHYLSACLPRTQFSNVCV